MLGELSVQGVVQASVMEASGSAKIVSREETIYIARQTVRLSKDCNGLQLAGEKA